MHRFTDSACTFLETSVPVVNYFTRVSFVLLIQANANALDDILMTIPCSPNWRRYSDSGQPDRQCCGHQRSNGFTHSPRLSERNVGVDHLKLMIRSRL